jgi:hypothetical protein
MLSPCGCVSPTMKVRSPGAAVTAAIVPPAVGGRVVASVLPVALACTTASPSSLIAT